MGFFVLIVGSNVFFLGYWVLKMSVEIKSMMVKKMQKLYLVLCLCMNRHKLEREILANDIAEENEILREDFMKSKGIHFINKFV